MSARFAESSAELAGLVGAVLGWTPDGFWRATPAEVQAVLRALAGPEGQGASAQDLDRLRTMFPDEGEAPPPCFAWSPSPAKAGEE